MSDDELLRKLAEINASAAFNLWAGIEVAAASVGRVELHLAWKPELGQYQGYLHAGVIGALLDTACGFAAFTQVGPTLASHFSVNCLAPAVGGRFVCSGEVVKAGRRQIFTRGELWAEAEAGGFKRVATGETILMTGG